MTLTPLQAEVIARIKATEADIRSSGRRASARRRAARLLELRRSARITMARVAVRYAVLCRLPLATAAREIDVPECSVRRAWRVMLPGVPAHICRRPR